MKIFINKVIKFENSVDRRKSGWYYNQASPGTGRSNGL